MATGHYRLENGTILEMDLPLADAYRTRVQRGEIVRVNSDGSPWEDTQLSPVSIGSTATGDALVAELAEARADLDLVTKQRDALVAELAELRQHVEEQATAQVPTPAPTKSGRKAAG